MFHVHLLVPQHSIRKGTKKISLKNHKLRSTKIPTSKEEMKIINSIIHIIAVIIIITATKREARLHTTRK